MITYQNGNATISLDDDGTRIIFFENNLDLDFPLNLDIRVSNKCSFGFNKKTNTSICDFCHESAIVDGSECNYNELKLILNDLPKGIELAIGSNNLTDNLIEFLNWTKTKGYIVNLTINQGHIKRDLNKILFCINNDLIKGLGISYREFLKWDIPNDILNYKNTVFHVIAGIDDINNIIKLKDLGVKKILILGEKDFGFNKDRVNLESQKHKEWLWFVRKLFDIFDVCSFDNLSLEQLKIKRFFPNDKWKEFYNGEYSFYINAVDKYFSPSSRNPIKIKWDNMTINEYFKQIKNEKTLL